MTSRAALELAHHHPGRLRLRSDALCATDEDEGWRERIRRIREALTALPGVHAVRHNERSGSVLIEYTPGSIEPDLVVEVAASAGDLDPKAPSHPPRTRRPALAAIHAARDLNAFAEKVMGGKLDLRSAVPLAMAGLAAYSFAVKKDRLPRWDNLAYWGYSIFLALHVPEIQDARDEEATIASTTS